MRFVFTKGDFADEDLWDSLIDLTDADPDVDNTDNMEIIIDATSIRAEE